jgi:predicted DNA binding CopG/RHH family protein
MSEARFEWDERKNRENRRKHGLSFEEAQAVFLDENALKQPITMRLDKATVAYFKALATELGMPYQNLINLYLRDCVLNRKKLELKWAS